MPTNVNEHHFHQNTRSNPCTRRMIVKGRNSCYLYIYFGLKAEKPDYRPLCIDFGEEPWMGANDFNFYPSWGRNLSQEFKILLNRPPPHTLDMCWVNVHNAISNRLARCTSQHACIAVHHTGDGHLRRYVLLNIRCEHISNFIVLSAISNTKFSCACT